MADSSLNLWKTLFPLLRPSPSPSPPPPPQVTSPPYCLFKRNTARNQIRKAESRNALYSLKTLHCKNE